MPFVGVSQGGDIIPIFDFNEGSGYGKVTIVWDGCGEPTANGIILDMAFSGTTNFCLDQSMSTINSAFANSPGTYTITWGSTSLRISNAPGGASFSVPSYQASFFEIATLYFRCAPNSSATFFMPQEFRRLYKSVNNVNSTVDIGDNGGFPSYSAPSAASIKSDIQKGQGTATCSNGTNNGVSDVTVKVEALNPGNCFPGVPNHSQTTPNGQYDIPGLTPYYSYKVSASKSSGAIFCGVGTEDIDLGRSILLGTVDPTLCELIALDVTQDNQWTAWDLTQILLIRNLGATNPDPSLPSPTLPANWENWQFFDSDYYGNNQPPIGWSNGLNLPKYYNTPVLKTTYSGNGFFGVKSGDLNGNCSDCDNFTGSNVERDIHENDVLGIPSLSLGAGEIVTLPVYFLGNDITVGVFDLELTFPDDILEVNSLENSYFPDEYTILSNYAKNGKGTVVFSAFSMELNGETFKKNEPLMYLNIRAKKDISDVSTVFGLSSRAGTNRLYPAATGASFRTLGIEKYIEPDFVYSAKIYGGNPVNTATKPMLQIVLPEEETVQILVTNLAGQVLDSYPLALSKGANIAEIKGYTAQPGVYQYTVVSSYGISSGKFAVVR